MRESGSGHWVAPAVLAGLAYAAVGIVFGWLAGAATSHQMNIAVALVAWPAIAAVPAYIVTLALGAVLSRIPRRT